MIAGAAGFGSVRQMNRVMEQIFRFTPKELRATRRKRDVLDVDGGLRLRIPTGSLLDVDQIVAVVITPNDFTIIQPHQFEFYRGEPSLTIVGKNSTVGLLTTV